MSIIHDALKKVQQGNPTMNTQPPASTPVPPPAPAPVPVNIMPSPVAPSPERTSIPLYVAALCAIVAMVFAVLPHFAPKASTPQPTALKSQPAPVAAAQTPQAPAASSLARAVEGAVTVPSVPRATVIPAPAPQANEFNPDDPLSTVHIEGIIDMGGKKAALINGNAYEEGQTIFGRIITDVGFDTMTVMENGRKRTLVLTPRTSP